MLGSPRPTITRSPCIFRSRQPCLWFPPWCESDSPSRRCQHRSRGKQLHVGRRHKKLVVVQGVDRFARCELDGINSPMRHGKLRLAQDCVNLFRQVGFVLCDLGFGCCRMFVMGGTLICKQKEETIRRRHVSDAWEYKDYTAPVRRAEHKPQTPSFKIQTD